MSHEETLRKMNADLNTPETWARRWQVEREQNERLNALAGMVRTGVKSLRARAVERYKNAKRWAEESRAGGDERKAEHYVRIMDHQTGMLRALDDVTDIMNTLSTEH